MAAQDGMNLTTLAETVHASAIANFIVPTPAATPLFQVLAKQFDCTRLPAGSNKLDVPSWDAFPATAEQTEADEFTSVDYETSKKTFTAVDPGTRALITDQIIQDSMLLQSGMVDQMIENVRQTLDLEVLELFKTATNQSDNTGVNLTLALWRTALAAFRAQKPRGEIAFVGSNNQIRDMIGDMAVVAGGNQLGDVGKVVFSSMVVDGYRGPYQGVHIFESSNVAANDASNDVGGFVALTPGAPPAMSGLGLAVWAPIEAKGVYVPYRKGYDVTVSARVGYQRVAEYMLRAFISKKAA